MQKRCKHLSKASMQEQLMASKIQELSAKFDVWLNEQGEMSNKEIIVVATMGGVIAWGLTRIFS